MSKKLNKLAYVLAVGVALAGLSGALDARPRGGGTPGAGAPGAGVRDPGVNQPGTAGNVGTPGVGAPGAGVVDPGINQPGAAGNVGGAVAARRIIATSVIVATLPPDCTEEVIEGTTVYECDGTYYQASDGQYQEVNVE